MKKTLLALITISIIPSTVLANESKNGVYISAKMGASILQMKGQFFPYNDLSTDLTEKQKGDNHRTAVFGTGLALGYDFYDNFNLPVRAELDFTSGQTLIIIIQNLNKMPWFLLETQSKIK